MKNTKKWPTDNEEHRRYCEDCEAKYKGVRECPDCESKNTFIDEVVLRPLNPSPKETKI